MSRPTQDPPPAAPVRFRPRATTIFRVGLAGVALTLAGAGYGAWQYYHSDYWNRIGFAPDQPVQFSHRHHAGDLRIDCRMCHASVEKAAFAGMPSTHTCLACHSRIFTDTAMLQPVVRSATEDRPLAWTRVDDLPRHVYFNHSIHVAKGVACTECHGDIGGMAGTAKAKPMTMRWCLDCHRDPGPRLHRREDLFSPHPLPPVTRSEGEQLLADYVISTRHLTNCSTCHH